MLRSSTSGFIALAMSLLLVYSCNQTAEKPIVLETGVAQELAQYRSQQISQVQYQLQFDIPNEITTPIAANLDLNVVIHDLTSPLILDFNPDRSLPIAIIVNEKKIKTIHEQEHISIPSQHLKLGKNKINIRFTAGELSLNRNEDYLYTLLVPDRARTLFPCFDQPDIKATYQLTITAPKEWKVLCGGSLQSFEELENSTRHQFGTTDLMSTYLFSFVAGKFESAKADEARSMTMLYRETDPLKIKTSIDPIFELHSGALDFLEDYTSSAFPFQKFDFAAIPGFQYGGMEHTGAIQYRESTLFLDNSATKSQELNRAKLIAHETAHMWFGNLVTMKWFNDVWLKEVFANLMADKIINPAYPAINHELQFLTSHYPLAYDVDRTKGANPIRQNLDNLNNAGSLYGSIIYHKAPIMMRQLESLLGAKKFQLGIIQYIERFSNSNADWNELIDILDEFTSMDLNQWSKAWVHSPGRPVITSEITYRDNEIDLFKIRQKAEDNSETLWPQIFEVSFVYTDTTIILPINLSGQLVEVTQAKELPKPNYIIYNSNGFGYGTFPVDEALIDNLASIDNEVARGSSYLNLFENTLSKRVEVADALTVLIAGLTEEQNELILQNITSNVNELFWSYLSLNDQGKYQSEIEKVLLQRLLEDDEANIKKTLFNLFQGIAYSDSGKSLLYQIWSNELKIKNLNLNEDDFTRLAMQLALYQHKQAIEILDLAKNTLTNPDKIKRFKFLLPALSNDLNERATFFESFQERKNREKENWVLTASYYIHHPLRQKTSIEQLRMSLDLLSEIQETGDIFFPKAWLDNTIGMYASRDAFDVLETFNTENENLNNQLKMKLLQASDNLYRLYE